MDSDRQAAGLIAATAVSTLLSMVYVVAAGRLLGVAAFGDFSAGLAIIYFVGTSAGPLGSTAAHFVAHFSAEGRLSAIRALKQRGERFLNRVMLLTAAVGLLVAAIAWQVSGAGDIPLFLAAGLAAVLVPLVLFDRGAIQGLRRFRDYNVNSILEAVVRLGFGLALLVVFRPTAALALSAYAIAFGVAWLDLRSRLPRIESDDREDVDWKLVLRYLGSTAIFIAAYAVVQNADLLVANYRLSQTDAGLYGATAALTRAMAIVAWPVNTLSIPLLTSLRAESRPVGPAFLRLAGWFALMAVPLLAVFAIAPELVIRLLYGDRFAAAATLLPRLALVAILTTANLLLGSALAALREFRFVSIYLVASVVQVTLMSVTARTTGELIAISYAVQGSLAVVLLTLFWRIARENPSR